MFYSLQDSYRLGVVAICLVAFLKHVQGISMEYCSTLNTGSGSANSSIYQSDGLCYDFCLDEYAFAVVQGSQCWCSNYVPGTTSSTSNCDTPCPGYPDDTCGGDSLYGYMSLTLAPSGTKGAATTSSTPTSTSSEKVTTSASSPEPVTTSSSTVEATSSSTIVQPKTTSSTSPTEASTTSTIPPTTVAAQKSSSSTSGSTSSTWTPTPVISLETITGQVRTVTVTPTAPPNSSSDSSGSKGDGGLTTGAAVGLTIGLVALIAIIAGIAYFCIRKRRQEKAERYAAVNSRRESLAGVAGVGGPIPSRTMSENSRFVLGTDGKRVVETWEPELHTPGSRRSQLMPVDPRLDPFAAPYQRGENRSRESINTIRDDHDYSRRVHQGPVLRAVNPDPD